MDDRKSAIGDEIEDLKVRVRLLEEIAFELKDIMREIEDQGDSSNSLFKRGE